MSRPRWRYGRRSGGILHVICVKWELNPRCAMLIATQHRIPARCNKEQGQEPRAEGQMTRAWAHQQPSFCENKTNATKMVHRYSICLCICL